MEWESLLNDFFRLDSLDRLVDDAGRALRCPLMVVDDSLRIAASHVPAGFHDGVFDSAVRRGTVTYEAGTALNDGGAAPVLLRDSPYPRRFTPLVTAGVRVGYLICVNAGGVLDGVTGFETLEAVLAKQLFLESARKGAAFSTAEEVLQHLLDGKFAGEEFFRLQAASTYLANFRPERFALLNLSGYRSLRMGDDALKNELMYLFYNSHPFLYCGEVLFFLHPGWQEEALRALCKKHGLRAVVSDRLDALYAMPQRYRAMREAMDELTARGAPPCAVRAEQFRPLQMLRALSGRTDLICPEVQALAERDRTGGTRYCETLYVYLSCHMSLTETCGVLYTHRNTILYRVRRMRDDFRLPLDEPGRCLELLVSAGLVLLARREDAILLRDFLTPRDE